MCFYHARSNMGDVEVEVALEFNTTASPTPEAEVVVSNFQRALNGSNNTFNLTIVPNSIEVVGKYTFNTWSYISLQ